MFSGTDGEQLQSIARAGRPRYILQRACNRHGFGEIVENLAAFFTHIFVNGKKPEYELKERTKTMKIKTNAKTSVTLAAALLICGANAAAQAPAEKTIYSFNSNGSGAEPITGLLKKNGVLYGTSAQGGGGSVYSLSRASAGAPWTEKLLYSLPANEGNTLFVALTGDDNVLYAASYEGGSLQLGMVISLTPPASPGGTWTPSVLYNFTGGSTDGYYPTALIAHDGVLYGTTQYGGTSNSGVAFSLTPPASPGGAWTEAVLHNFTGGSDGGFPNGLTAGADGILYGTALFGGYANFGVVFLLAPPASPGGDWTEHMLYSFKSGTDGEGPRSVTIGSGGVLYGTTSNGGSQPGVNCGEGCGTVYSLTPPASPGQGWSETILYTFGGGADGAYPYASVVIGGGVLYGTTSGGGGVLAPRCYAGCGTVFSLTPPESAGSAWIESVLHAFKDEGVDGSNPQTPLLLDGSVLYGTTQLGGTYKYGTVFQVKP